MSHRGVPGLQKLKGAFDRVQGGELRSFAFGPCASLREVVPAARKGHVRAAPFPFMPESFNGPVHEILRVEFLRELEHVPNVSVRLETLRGAERQIIF